ncbi:MAG: protein kinase domain-containing protein [Planctomycetota bacterium]|jgi:predicted Ser/Thr protein kinase
MQIHCAFCGKPFEREDLPEGGEVECPHCNRSFDLASRETLAYDELAGDDPKALVGKRLKGYRIEREIGRGGMGIVYEGVQESLERKVAIKVLFREACSDPHFVARFEREAESLARLAHPNIINILDRGSVNGIYFFVMEYVDGISLRELMNQGPLNPAEAMAIIPVLCAALEYAHGEGVIHRDIKPENILIDKQGRVKVADFGLSRIVRGEGKGTRITHSKMVMGTPDYMAPEQREDSKGVDHRADIFSLGVVFYEMLTGELPMGRFPPPSQKDIRIDVRLDEIVLKVLDKDPACRYQRASDIATDIHSLAQDGSPAGAEAAAASPRIRHAPPGDRPRARSFMEILEDGWESWVLVVAIILTVVDFFPFVFFLVAWFALYKPMRQRRLARLAERNDFAEPRPEAPDGKIPASPAGEGAREGKALPPEGWIEIEEAKKELGTAWKELKALLARGKLRFQQKGKAMYIHPEDVEKAGKGAPPPVPVPPPPGPVPPSRRTSKLAMLASMYGLAILLVIPILIPFQGEIEAQYRGLALEEKAGALSLGVLVALPGLFGLLLAVVARTRVSVHDHLGGSFLATLGLLASVVFLGVGAHLWIEAHDIYRSWVDVRERARRGDEQVIPLLRKAAQDPATRRVALREASRMPVSPGRKYFAWAVEQNEDLKRDALIAWARAYPSDPETRSVVWRHTDELLKSGEVERRLEALDIMRLLPGANSQMRLPELVGDASPRVRRAVAECLEAWKGVEMKEETLVLSMDRDPGVAEAGLEAFTELADALSHPEWVEGLTHVLKLTPHTDLKEEVIRELRRAHKKSPLPPESVAALEEAAKDPELAEHVKHALGDVWKTKKKKSRTTRAPPPKKGKTVGPARQVPDDGE